MTPEQASDLAERTLAAIDADDELRHGEGWHTAADRERVASDLAGLRDHAEWYSAGCECGKHWPCRDAARYADGLRRTAALYGVTP